MVLRFTPEGVAFTVTPGSSDRPAFPPKATRHYILDMRGGQVEVPPTDFEGTRTVPCVKVAEDGQLFQVPKHRAEVTIDLGGFGRIRRSIHGGSRSVWPFEPEEL